MAGQEGEHSLAPLKASAQGPHSCSEVGFYPQVPAEGLGVTEPHDHLLWLQSLHKHGAPHLLITPFHR